MTSERDRSEFDQNTAFLADSLPPFWRRMYEKLISEGFNKDEAMQLLQTWIHSQHGDRKQ